jgi:hypothetical protein
MFLKGAKEGLRVEGVPTLPVSLREIHPQTGERTVPIVRLRKGHGEEALEGAREMARVS